MNKLHGNVVLIEEWSSLTMGLGAEKSVPREGQYYLHSGP